MSFCHGPVAQFKPFRKSYEAPIFRGVFIPLFHLYIERLGRTCLHFVENGKAKPGDNVLPFDIFLIINRVRKNINNTSEKKEVV